MHSETIFILHIAYVAYIAQWDHILHIAYLCYVDCHFLPLHSDTINDDCIYCIYVNTFYNCTVRPFIAHRIYVSMIIIALLHFFALSKAGQWGQWLYCIYCNYFIYFTNSPYIAYCKHKWRLYIALLMAAQWDWLHIANIAQTFTRQWVSLSLTHKLTNSLSDAHVRFGHLEVAKVLVEAGAVPEERWSLCYHPISCVILVTITMIARGEVILVILTIILWSWSQ